MRNKLSPFSVVLLVAGLLVNGFYLLSLAPDAKLATWFYDSNVNKHTGCDFYALYLAGHNLTNDKNIYQGDPQHKIVPCHYSYRYLPTGAYLGIPLAVFKPQKAYLYWVVILELLLLANLVLLLYAAPSDKIFGLGAFGFLGASPLYLELYMGQYSLLQGTLIFAALVALHKGKEAQFHGAWGASLCWKMNTWIALPALVKAKKWWGMAGALALIAITSGPYFLSHKGTWATFIGNFMPDPSSGITRGNHGLVGFCAQFFSGQDLRLLLIILPVVIISISLFFTFKFKRAHLIDAIALWMSVYFLAYKHVWEHHYVMLIPIIVILAIRHKNPILLIPALLVALPTVYPLATAEAAALGSGELWLKKWEYLYHIQKPAAAFAVYLFSVFKMRRT